jgi:hypothetical protein
MPRGVTLIAPSWEYYGAASTTLTLEFAVDPEANPTTDALASINWDAGDGEQKGRIDLSFTVLLRPDSRTFSDVIVTPPARRSAAM